MPIDPRARDEAVARADFESLLRNWARTAGAFETVGKVDGYGQRPWLFVRHLERLYHLNADSRRKGVLDYLGLLAADPDVEWRVVPNRRGNLNKVAFGADERVIPKFYLYLSK